jgi:hypothetical protein
VKLSEAGFRPLPTPVPHEWVEEERKATFGELLATIKIRKDSLDLDPKFRYFVDGVPRLATIGFLDLGIKIPVIASNIAVGACEVKNGKVVPCRDFTLFGTVLLLPETAVRTRLPNFRLPLGRGSRLDHRGDFINKVRIGVPSNPLGDLLLCDTTFDFQRKQKVDAQALAAPGYVHSRALSALKGILRALEVGLVGRIRSARDEFVVLDGPLARDMFLMYGRLADSRLRGIDRIADPSKTFDFLRRVVGVVKRVIVVPGDQSFQSVFQNDEFFNIPVYRHLVVDPKKGGETHLLCCFIYLRPEITRVMPGYPGEGLIRVDIPIPSIMDRYEPDWHIKRSLTLSDQAKSRLEDVLRSLLALRKPLPCTTERHKIFSELYPIDRVEAFLKSRLLSYSELRVRTLNELMKRGLL